MATQSVPARVQLRHLNTLEAQLRIATQRRDHVALATLQPRYERLIASTIVAFIVMGKGR